MIDGRSRWVTSTRVAIAGVAVLAAACGGGDDKSDTSAEDTTTTTAEPDGTTSTTEEAEPGFIASEVAAGDQHACALDLDGAAFCWGYNEMGQLGDGSNEDSLEPVAVAGDLTFTALTAGRYFTCGITTDGATFCWGDNSSGQLGDGTTGKGGDTENRNEPVEVLGDLDFDELVTGQSHICGLAADGATSCWGAFASGQLGNDLRPDQVQPSPSADGLTFESLTAGGTSSCGLDADGIASCWGNNSFGQLGDGEITNAAQHEPREVSATGFTSLAMGRVHTCGLDDEGAAFCWGQNPHGELGDGTTEDRSTPTAVLGDHTFVSLTAGITHTCGITDDGAALCWGANTVGQLGDGSGNEGEDRTEPVEVVGGLTFTALSAGEEFTCGIADDDSLHCWGTGLPLGTGTGEPTTEPVAVKAV